MRVMLIDGMSLLYRSYYSTRIEKNNRGEPVNAVRKFLIYLDSFLKEYPCDDIIICEDAPKSTLIRQQLYPEYKGGRRKSPDELNFQKSVLFGILRKLGLPVVGCEGYEADDIIGTLSRILSEEGTRVLIVSPDKDMYQLMVSDHVGIIQRDNVTKTQVLLFRDDIRRICGYWPEQVIDLKILCGDSSDNIPGIPKCGIKRAVKFLQKFGSIENFLTSEEHDDGFTDVRDYLISQQDVIQLHRSLITIQTHIPSEIISKQMAYRVTGQTMLDTLNRYQLFDMDRFSDMIYYSYLMNRAIKEEN